MRYFVTLFDSNYLTRGLILFRSLMRYAGKFHLWIICFDDLAHELLTKLDLDNVTLVSLSEFEDSELLRVKTQRTRAEYCWTCTPSTALYVLNQFPYVDAITYLDADLMFFSSPEPIFAEAGDTSILITEHRYLPEYDKAATNGIYNVQFVMFRRDSEGVKALNWWRDRCLEWCFARCEDNKFGDQKYLDDWTERFNNVHVLQHLGGGLAPWNATRYKLKKLGKNVYVETDILIFYHFHQLAIHPFNIVHLGFYPINQDLIDWVYSPYLKELNYSYRIVRRFQPKSNLGIVGFLKSPPSLIDIVRFIRNILRDWKRGKYRKYA